MRKLRRTSDYEFILDIKNDRFIDPPRASQRNWLLNRAAAEFAADLAALDDLARGFVSGTESIEVQERAQAQLSDDEIMEDWQIPLMQTMAETAAGTHGDVLEIGFGRGVSASLIQDAGVRSHTIVECNESVIQRFHAWKAQYPQADIRLIPGRWQEVTGSLDCYDGIFFHTFPLDEQEYLQQAVNSVTFAENFFPTAAAHLHEGGSFTYMTNEIDSLSRSHQRLLFRHFRSFSLQVQALQIPETTRDTWWANSMVVVRAVK